MTRAEIEQEYTIQDGVIQDLGRFECQAIYVPFYWDMWMNGWCDSDDGNILRFKVSKEDREQFPELKGRHWVRLIQTEQGFVEEI